MNRGEGERRQSQKNIKNTTRQRDERIAVGESGDTKEERQTEKHV